MLDGEKMIVPDLLGDLEQFEIPTAEGTTEQVQEVLAVVAAARDRITRAERQITVVGALKSGKSSLLNALIGASLLPVRANRATGVVTVIRHGPAPAARVVRSGPDGLREEEVQFDDVQRLVLLDLSGAVRKNAGAIHEIRIDVPLPWLVRRCILVDTPGLVDDPAMTERTFGEIERSDLVIMVLAADKILSAREREAAAQTDRLLRGNIVYVVNRLDLIDEEDRDEVVAWAESALSTSGNKLIGRPRIFATAALRRQSTGSPNTGGSPARGVEALAEWLERLLTDPLGDHVAALSRLSLLEHSLIAAGTQMAAELAARRETTERARRDDAVILQRERQEMKRLVARCRAELQDCRAALTGLLERFVDECLTEDNPPNDRGDRTRLTIDEPLRDFGDSVTELVRSAVEGQPVPTAGGGSSLRDPLRTELDLHGWIVRLEVETARHPTGEIATAVGELATRMFDGGSAGRQTGATIGGWIGKNVFGVDTDEQTLGRLERAVRAVVPSLRAEAEAYVTRIDTALAEAESACDTWSRPAPAIISAEAEEERYAELMAWVGNQLSVISYRFPVISSDN